MDGVEITVQPPSRSPSIKPQILKSPPSRRVSPRLKERSETVEDVSVPIDSENLDQTVNPLDSNSKAAKKAHSLSPTKPPSPSPRKAPSLSPNQISRPQSRSQTGLPAATLAELDKVEREAGREARREGGREAIKESGREVGIESENITAPEILINAAAALENIEISNPTIEIPNPNTEIPGLNTQIPTQIPTPTSAITNKRSRSADDANEGESDPGTKRRSRKGGPKRLQNMRCGRTRFEGDDDEEFAERVHQEYVKVRTKLIEKYGDSGPGRQKGWRMHLHSRTAIAERMREQEEAALEQSIQPTRQPNKRSRKSGAYSVPNTATALAAEFPSHESTEPEISADEDLEEFRPRVTINSQNPNRSRRTRSQGEKADQGDKTNQRGSRKSNRGQSNGLSGVKETMKRVGKQNAVARSSDPLSAKRPVSPKRPPARRAVTAKALPGDAVVDKQPELEQVEDAKLESGSMQPSETRQVVGVGGLSLSSKPQAGKILGLGGGLPSKRPQISKFKELRRDNLHVDGREKQNHCAIFRNTLYISGIRVPDALLQLRKTYAGQVASILDILEKLLLKNGSSKDQILTATIVLQSPQKGLAALNDAWDKWIPDPRNLPARTVIGGSLLSPDEESEDVLAEISVVAAIQ